MIFKKAIKWILTCEHNLNLLLKNGEPLLGTVCTLPTPFSTLKTPSNSFKMIYEDFMTYDFLKMSISINLHVNTT